MLRSSASGEADRPVSGPKRARSHSALVVETATYFHSKPLVSKTDTRESVIRDAETWLDAAGITTPEVRRSMFNNALEAEGMEPMAEGEGEGQ